MDEKILSNVKDTKEKLLSDLPKFLELEGKEQFFLGEQIETYTNTTLEILKGHLETDKEFIKFVNVLFECKQLDDFGEKWAPTKEKVLEWIKFLKNFNV